LKYIPAEFKALFNVDMLERTWKYSETELFRAEKLYTAANYQTFIDVFKSNFPDFVYFCPFRNKELISAPLNAIKDVFVPKDCLSALRRVKSPDSLQAVALDLINMLSKESGIGLADLGIHGSIALNMHSPQSDIDFLVYGSRNFRAIEQAISELVNGGKLSYIFGNRLEAARRFHGRYKGKVFMYNATRKPEEIKDKYGRYRYSPLDNVRFECTVTDDSETMFRPATYTIANYKPLDPESELSVDKVPNRVVSNIGCYRNIARQGKEIKVGGKLERVEAVKTGESFYQVVVGTATAEEEYIWPV
jgi:predicted nucleotidyltransferase